jgi:hypothetical protein
MDRGRSASEPLGPSSLAWRYFSDWRGMLVGLWAGSMQNMHPGLGAGVEEHSKFFDERWERLLTEERPATGRGHRTDDRLPAGDGDRTDHPFSRISPLRLHVPVPPFPTTWTTDVTDVTDGPDRRPSD